MSFIDSYKRLEKLCGEIMNNDRRLSAYIDEMLNTPYGKNYVHNWDEDLKALKHYRWVRNQISHEPGCTEANMCEPEDEIWLNNFYSRIMKQTDPLSMYRKARSAATRPQRKYIPDVPQTHINPPPPRQKHNYTGIILLGIALLIFLILLLNK